MTNIQVIAKTDVPSHLWFEYESDDRKFPSINWVVMLNYKIYSTHSDSVEAGRAAEDLARYFS